MLLWMYTYFLVIWRKCMCIPAFTAWIVWQWPTIVLHLLQQLHSTLLLSGIVVEHSLDKVPGHKHFFRKNVQKLVIDGEVSLNAKLRHLLQSSVYELYVTPPSYVSLGEDVHHFVKRGFGFGLFGHLLKQVIMGDQKLVPLVVVIIDKLCRCRTTVGAYWANVKMPQHLQVKVFFRLHVHGTGISNTTCSGVWKFVNLFEFTHVLHLDTKNPRSRSSLPQSDIVCHSSTKGDYRRSENFRNPLCWCSPGW